ncbi:hypothetical protein E2C01_013982 [Portunus trituberculatus]|uniref:Uncharacterized protein n=1 Tax=Portunus trituberculatus TaxID=210409 RepID=A0A5B7DIX7_PORTR|nr:hypothetical protein [Portunus trituberculatus]
MHLHYIRTDIDIDAESHGNNVHLIKRSDQDAGNAAGNGSSNLLLRRTIRVGTLLLDSLSLSATLELTLWNRGHIFLVHCAASTEQSGYKSGYKAAIPGAQDVTK